METETTQEIETLVIMHLQRARIVLASSANRLANTRISNETLQIARGHTARALDLLDKLINLNT